MEIVKILLTAVFACVLSVIVSQYKPEFALFIRLAAVGLIIVAVTADFSDVARNAFSFADGLKINSEYILLLVKALIIAVACRVVSDICTDTGNKAIAACVDLAGRLAIMLLAVPLLAALSQLAKELIKE